MQPGCFLYEILRFAQDDTRELKINGDTQLNSWCQENGFLNSQKI